MTLPDVALYMLSSGKELAIEEQTKKGNTALMLACSQNMADVALAIIHKYPQRCHIDAINAIRKSALFHACQEGMHEVATE